jgi:hypothetical protein
MKSLALAFLLFATAAIEVNTGKLAEGAVETFTSGSRQVAVHKSGDTTTVRVQEGERVDTVTLTRAGDGKLSIGRSDNGVVRRFIVVDRPKVVVDGIDLEPYLMDSMAAAPQSKVVPLPAPMPQQKPTPGDRTYYVCPKDATIVVTPTPSATGRLLCPVDGTPLKAGTGPEQKFFLLQ